MPFEYRLTHLSFRDGSSLSLPQLTVLVGANNSGKSRLLKDIVSITCTEQRHSVILADVPRELPASSRAAVEAYGINTVQESNGNRFLRFLKPTFDGQQQYGLGQMVWPDGLGVGAPSREQFSVYFGSQLTAFLTTSHRLRLIEEGSLSANERSSLLQELYSKGAKAEKLIRRYLKRAFPNTEIALDFSEPPKIQFRIAPDFSQLPPDPRDANAILRECERLDDQGDGIRSYAGIVTALKCSARPVFLIDEPEAFLHPPQAFRIGEFIASCASSRCQIVVATHSIDTLRGLISGTNDLLVVHLDRVGQTTHRATLENTDIRTLFADPLLSGSGILNGLFYAGVVVTEADADTRFYSAISTKVNKSLDLHFINADNKQTVPKVLTAYKKMGVRAVGIVDIDVLNDTSEFSKCMDELGVIATDRAIAMACRDRIEAEVKAAPLTTLLQEISDELGSQKSAIDAVISNTATEQEAVMRSLRAALGNLREKASAWAVLKKQGKGILVSSIADFEAIAAILQKYGVLINPAGELEASLVRQGLPWRVKKREWFRDAMNLIPKLQVVHVDQPWKLIADAHSLLATR